MTGLPWRVLSETWESSSHALEMAHTMSEMVVLVELRQVLLVEMETHHPRHFSRWHESAVALSQTPPA